VPDCPSGSGTAEDTRRLDGLGAIITVRGDPDSPGDLFGSFRFLGRLREILFGVVADTV